MTDLLNFKTPSKSWNDGLPIGSGRLAAMLWENNDKQILSLNNENIWTGDYKDRTVEKADHFLSYVRDYLLRGENFKATALAAIAFGGNGGISPLLRRMDSYQPAFDIVISGLKPFKSRELNLKSATATVNRDDITITAYCHSVDDLFILDIDSVNKESFTISCNRDSQKGQNVLFTYNENTIFADVDLNKGVSFKGKCIFDTDGKVSVFKDYIKVDNSTHFSLVADVISEYENRDFDKLKTKADISKHIDNFNKYYSKFNLSLEGDENLDDLSIEERVERIKEGKHDPELVALFARFGIYLFIAGSITARLPLNLQGKWNHVSFPKWNCDYHLNINPQMNYWFSEALSFDSFTNQLLSYVSSLVPEGRKAAKLLYGCRGIMLGLNSDYFRKISPEAYNYAVWIGAAGWLSTHFWKHYLQTGDKGFLKDIAYPFIKEAAIFYEDYLVSTDDGTTLIMPSQSPENRYEGCGYFPVSMCINSAMDKEICRDTLTIAIEASNILGLDQDEAKIWASLLKGLPECAIGSDGRLLEWDSEDKIELEKGHRHFSHLYGVYPSSQFTPEKEVDKYEAAKKSLEYRLKYGSGHTGWSLAWGACLYARFLDGDMVEYDIEKLISTLCSQSLLDLHPDYFPQKERPTKGQDDPFLFGAPKNMEAKVFQIDGNFGSTAAIIEALIQCRDNIVYLLTARAKSWSKGVVGPVRLDDGNYVSFEFEEDRITSLSITFGWREQINIVFDDSVLSFKGKKGETIKVL